MPNYANGKIYAIRSRSRPDLVYIGSTTQQLSKRYAEHVRDWRAGEGKVISYLVIEIGDSYIELIEAYPCKNKEELRRREGEVQRSIPCVNIRIEGRTPAEYREDNKEEIDAYHR